MGTIYLTHFCKLMMSSQPNFISKIKYDHSFMVDVSYTKLQIYVSYKNFYQDMSKQRIASFLAHSNSYLLVSNPYYLLFPFLI